MKKGTTLRDFLVLRRKAVKLAAHGWTQDAIAEALDCAQSTVSGWLADYRQRGADSFAYPQIGGRQRRITPDQCTQLVAMLEQGAEAHGFTGAYWNRPRVKELVERSFGIAYHLNSISTLLRDLGYTRQKPQSQSYQQDATRVAQWTRERLPALKKKQGRKDG